MSGEARPTFAMYGAGSCGGCDIAVLNVHEKILEIGAAFEVVLWPVVMDAKYRDLEARPDSSIDLTLFSGGIRTDENADLARLLRRKTKLLVAFGSCAGEGCIPGLANLTPPAEILDTVYETVSTENPDHLRPGTQPNPGGPGQLAGFAAVLRTLDQVVDVDYFVPGCPPESPRIAEVLDLALAALRGGEDLPPRGAVLGAGESTVCDECARTRNVKQIAGFRRIQEIDHLDPTLCLLEQGIPCNGAATASGCGALCPTAGAQCVGCYGPVAGAIDGGARLMSAFASVAQARTAEEMDRILDGLVDPIGQFYRFGLAKSLLRASRSAWAAAGGEWGRR